MSVNLKITLGAVNYTDYLHVTAAKVSQPSVVIWETWIVMPVSNYNFVIPGLDPENYYVSFYDAPTSASLGTLQSQMIVNAFTGDTLIERRFYICGGEGATDPADGALSIVDPYLIGKTVSGFFKEAFRYYQSGVEFDFDNTTGTINILTGVPLSSGEKVTVEIFYKNENPSNTSSGVGGLYEGTITVTEATRTLSALEVNSRVRLNASTTQQVITLPILSSFADGKGFYFDNSIGGTAIQVKLLCGGTDNILFDGFNVSSNLFSEFWVSRGEHLLLRKYGSYWEVIGDYEGVHVGEKVTLGYNGHPNTLVEMNQLLSGDDYPRLWWWINNVLPATNKYTRNSAGDINTARVGQFSLHATEKKFWMPYTIYMAERGLHNFNSAGVGDPNRIVPYPGGYQAAQVGTHKHTIRYFWNNRIDTGPTDGVGRVGFINPNNKIGFNTNETGTTDDNAFSAENRVANVGVIFARRI